MLAAVAISVVRDYGIIDITDDAIAPPVMPSAPARGTHDDEEQWAARLADHAAACAKVAEEWRAAFERATETGEWASLLVPGKAPTVFRVRQIGTTAWAAFKRSMIANKLVDDQIHQLAVRLALVGLDGFPVPIHLARGLYVDDSGRRERTFGDVLTEETIDTIARALPDKEILNRVGAAILQQRGAPLGK